MRIIRKYVCEGAGGLVANHYAIVELDDSSRVELNSQTPKNEEAWLEAAASYQAAIAEPEPTIEIEAEDDAII